VTPSLVSCLQIEFETVDRRRCFDPPPSPPPPVEVLLETMERWECRWESEKGEEREGEEVDIGKWKSDSDEEEGGKERVNSGRRKERRVVRWY
jgi:hypothetical protein